MAFDSLAVACILFEEGLGGSGDFAVNLAEKAIRPLKDKETNGKHIELGNRILEIGDRGPLIIQGEDFENKVRLTHRLHQ